MGGTTRIKTTYGSYCGNISQSASTLASSPNGYQNGNLPTLLDLMMTPADQSSTGVSNLSVAQKTALTNWIVKYTEVMSAMSGPQNALSARSALGSRLSSTTPDVIESQIDGAFHGWSGDTIFKLTNGQIWQQAEYDYDYEYDYMPDVTIYKTTGCYKMKVQDVDDAICVKRIK